MEFWIVHQCVTIKEGSVDMSVDPGVLRIVRTSKALRVARLLRGMLVLVGFFWLIIGLF